MRTKAKRGLDRKIFRSTASSTKRINISPVIMRGGIRL